MRLRMVLFFMAVGLMGGCSDTTAALSGFGNANISPHERSLIKQGPLRRVNLDLKAKPSKS